MSIEASIKTLEQSLAQKRAEKHLLENRLAELEKTTIICKHDLSVFSDAREILASVHAATQGKVKGFIEGIVTSALRTVYGENYEFQLRFDIKRHQAEVTSVLLKGGVEFNLKDEVGGGVVDLVSFTSRLALWALTTPRSDAVFFFDEPFKWASRDLYPRLCIMLQELSRALEIQMVIVTHIPELVECGDQVWSVSQEKGISKVVLLKEEA